MGSGTSSKKGQKGADEVQNNNKKSENVTAPELEANSSAAQESKSVSSFAEVQKAASERASQILEFANKAAKAVSSTILSIGSKKPDGVEKVLIAEFNRRDIDHSGGLSRDEIATFLQDIGWTDMTAEEIFSHYDKNNNDLISLDEFITWQRHAHDSKSERKGGLFGRVGHILKSVFNQHDANKDGTVTVAQLQKIFRHHGLDADAKCVFAFADLDINRSVTMQDYLNWQEKQWDAQKQSESLEEIAAEFDPEKTTEENYARKDQTNDVYTPAYSRERGTLDYSYHKRYTIQRQQVQDRIAHHYRNQYRVKADHKPILPWLLFTAGAMGCGKGYVKKWLARNGYLPLDMFVQVDMDDIRARLPEWPEYLQNGQATAGERTQKEAGMIAELVTHNALRRRRNILLDGSLRNKEYYSQYLDSVLKNYPGVRVGIIHVVVQDEAVVQRRVLKRAEEEGRKVPPSIVTNSFNQVPKSVAYFGENYCDFCCRITNEENAEPELTPEPAFAKGHSTELTWDFFKKIWDNASLDVDGDGVLSQKELHNGVQSGLVSQKVVQSMDADGDGFISTYDLEVAEKIADMH